MPATDIAHTDIGYSPRAGVIWEPDARSTYYISYSYAFLPSAEQLGLTTTNANLEPETAKNYRDRRALGPAAAVHLINCHLSARPQQR